jgi:gamma-glutamyl:cysteine ligase YbdK (ATP-grasp superfamily)
LGAEIHKLEYSTEDFENFTKAWLDELAFVKSLFEAGKEQFCSKFLIGYELESCILDTQNQPAPYSHQIIDALGSDRYTTELANYDLEMNGSVFEIDQGVTAKIEKEIKVLLDDAHNIAQKLDAKIALFGVFPGLKEEHFDRERFQSDMVRYTMASRRIYELRHESIKLLFHGEDEVTFEREDVMSEALSTSLQIHFQIPFEHSVEYYHAALFASMIMVGVSANSPLVFGKRAWHESRIPIFEQSVDARDQSRRERGDEKRVQFGQGYIESWLDLFEHNKIFKILFADVVDETREKLYHFSLHNGTIWRWVRPIISQNDEGKWSLRMELRVIPSGPTQIDLNANIWFFIGLIQGIIKSGFDVTMIPFESLKNDFYTMAKFGLEGQFHTDESEQKMSLQTWLEQEGEGFVKRGLSDFGIEADEIIKTIKGRITKGQNGAIWQLKHFEKYQDIDRLVKEYLKNYEQNIPVHEWSI